ncbi:MAG: hypothetical protein Fur0037_08460 [Planctomycetota bacterium]
MKRLFSCRENARMASLALDGKLSLSGRLLLRMHLWMCAGCRAFSKQIRDLSRLFSTRSAREWSGAGSDALLSEEARARIAARLREDG